MQNFTPFDDDGVLSIGGLSIENSGGGVAVYGDVLFAHAHSELIKAQALLDFATALVDKLQNAPDFAQNDLQNHDSAQVDNPFA